MTYWRATSGTDAYRRLLAWPKAPLPPLHSVFAVPDAIVDDGVIYSEWGDRAPIKPLSEELFLDLVNLDLGDESAICSLVRRMGFLDGGFTETPGVEQVADGLERQRRNARRRFSHRLDGKLEFFDSGAVFVDSGELLDEFRWAARCFRDLFRCYRLLRFSERPTPWESEIWQITPELKPKKREQASALLASELTAGLVGFAPRVALVGQHSGPEDTWGERLGRMGKSAAPLLEEPTPIPDDAAGRALSNLHEYGDEGMDHFASGYATCCRQLFNHMVENAPLHVCDNPTCRELFVRGYRRDGSPRQRDSTYCSDSCADAVRKRHSRARRSTNQKPG